MVLTNSVASLAMYNASSSNNLYHTEMYYFTQLLFHILVKNISKSVQADEK